jgi:LysM repeat protein
MKSWSEMTVGERGGVAAGVAVVIAILGYGLWGARQPNAPQVVMEQPLSTPAEEPAATAPEGQAQTEAPAADAAAPTPAVPDTASDAAQAAPTDAQTDAQTEAQAEAQAEAPTEAPAVAAESAAPASAENAAAPETQAEPVAAAPEIVLPEPPTFDLVRVEKDGSALVAGAGAAMATIVLNIDGAEIASVPTDGRGKFVAMFNLAPSPAPRLLSMAMRLADGTLVPAAATVAIAPTVAPEPQVAVAGAEPAPEVGTDLAPAPETQAPAALLITEEGAKVLQSAESAPLAMVSNVTIDTISYGADGAVQLAGRGTAAAALRFYLDNAVLAEGRIGADGNWAETLPEIAPGIYTLRVDQLDDTGKVTSRFETPFKRETVAALAQAAGSASQSGAVATEASPAADMAAEQAAERPVSVTVQPGFTLWRIARETLGEGMLYVQVFEANKDQIRDPDLIYPGQVFAIPTAE